jgi:hypothetical protein
MPTSTALRNASPEEFRKIIKKRRSDRMAAIDNLDPDVRSCVHEYGWNVVHAFMLLGVNRAKHIRHLVETVLNEFSPTRGSSSAQGTRSAKGIGPDHPLNRS